MDGTLPSNFVYCVSALWDKGKSSECFPEVQTLFLKGLETGDYLVSVSIESANRGLVLSSKSVNFEVNLNEFDEPMKIWVTFPRNEEVLSVSEVSVHATKLTF